MSFAPNFNSKFPVDEVVGGYIEMERSKLAKEAEAIDKLNTTAYAFFETLKIKAADNIQRLSTIEESLLDEKFENFAAESVEGQNAALDAYDRVERLFKINTNCFKKLEEQAKTVYCLENDYIKGVLSMLCDDRLKSIDVLSKQIKASSESEEKAINNHIRLRQQELKEEQQQFDNILKDLSTRSAVEQEEIASHLKVEAQQYKQQLERDRLDYDRDIKKEELAYRIRKSDAQSETDNYRIEMDSKTKLSEVRMRQDTEKYKSRADERKHFLDKICGLFKPLG